MTTTTTRSAQRRAEHLRALRDHPSTSPEEREAAEEALRRLGGDTERPRVDERARWRRDFDKRIHDIQMQIVTVNCALHEARIAEARATTLRRVYEGELADLQHQLDHQRAWRAAAA
ncbi:hypothetical protein ACXYTP_21690 [Tsukamurella ocularis]